MRQSSMERMGDDHMEGLTTMNPTKKLLLILLGATMMLSFFGCGKQKYKLQYDLGFQSEKTEYEAGEKVTVYFNLIATDTDYRFWLDDESVELEQDYDEKLGYVFTFQMPEHDVTLHRSSRNTMVALERILVTLENRVEEADFWLLPQTEENLKTSLWGTATVGSLAVGDSAEVVLTKPDDAETWIIRIIDKDHILYTADDLKLKDGDRIVFRREDADFDGVIEILDENGTVLDSKTASAGALGAE